MFYYYRKAPWAINGSGAVEIKMKIKTNGGYISGYKGGIGI